MPRSAFAKECQKLFKTTNLYEILGLSTEKSKELTEKEIKRAYYKCSLKYHPDRVQDDDNDGKAKELATKKFQLLGRVYMVLSDAEKRGLYDESGVVDEEDNINDRDMYEVWRGVKVSFEDIDNFKQKYKGTEEECEDLKELYLKYEGDMKKIYDGAFCCDSEDDRDRIRLIIQHLIDAGEVEHFSNFDRKETEQQKKRRLRKAAKEAAEAEEMLKEMTGKEKMNKDELVNAIAKRSAARSASFLDQLETKYGGPSGKGGSKKKRNVDDEDEQKNKRKTKKK